MYKRQALDSPLQDILTRFKRMQGYSALWLPGTDHAGIATQIKVEEDLRVNEGKTRYDLGREKFLERVWQWKEKYGGRIVEQQKKLGASCDWERARFTICLLYTSGRYSLLPRAASPRKFRPPCRNSGRRIPPLRGIPARRKVFSNCAARCV